MSQARTLTKTRSAVADEPAPKKQPTVWPSRRWAVAGTLAATGATAALWLFNNALDPYLGGAGSTQALAISGTFLSVVMLAALVIGWVDKYTPPPLPQINKQITHPEDVNGLGVEEILQEEFKYAAKTAEQAMEHRMAIVNIYLLVAGGAGSGVIAFIGANKSLSIAAVPLLWIIVLVGLLTLLQIIALRRAWAGSAMEMNYIKEFYVFNSRMFHAEDLKKAFLWDPRTLPPTHKLGNVHHYSAMLIGLLNTTAFLGSIFLLGWTQGATLTAPASIGVAAFFALIFFLTHQWLYGMMLIPVPKKGQHTKKEETMSASMDHTILQPTNFAAGGPTPGNTVLSSEMQYRGRILNLRIDQVRLPDGSESVREIVEHKPAVVILAYLEATDEILLVRNFRDPLGRTLLELPAGMLDGMETVEAAAQRELFEETGYQAGTVQVLGSYFTSPGFTDERHTLVLATQVRRVAGIQDTREIQAIEVMPRAQAVALALNGGLEDGKSILGLLWADRVLPQHV